MTNPYEPTSEPPLEDGDFRRVTIKPMDRLSEAKALMGDQYWLFVGIVAVGLILGSLVPFGVLMGPLFCGIFMCYRQRFYGRRARFDLLFKGFDYFLQSFIAMLLMMLASMAVFVPIYLVGVVAIVGLTAGAQGNPEALGAGMIIVVMLMYAAILVVMILVTLPFVFALQLIVDRELQAIDAIKLSFRAAFAHFPGLVGMLLLYMLIGLLATCACYLPYFLFAPLAMGALNLVYRDVFGISSQPLPEQG